MKSHLKINDLERELQSLPQPYVVMAVGVPGSGKTTILSELAQKLHISRICPDEIRKELTGSEADQSVNQQAWDIAYDRIRRLLVGGKPVVVDATHAEAWRRPSTIEKYRSYGATSVVAIVISTPLEIAKRRNSLRERVVPEQWIDSMHKELESEPPTTEEGFDKVIAAETA